MNSQNWLWKGCCRYKLNHLNSLDGNETVEKEGENENFKVVLSSIFLVMIIIELKIRNQSMCLIFLLKILLYSLLEKLCLEASVDGKTKETHQQIQAWHHSSKLKLEQRIFFFSNMASLLCVLICFNWPCQETNCVMLHFAFLLYYSPNNLQSGPKK